jgi:hypothetical protein
LLPRYQGDTLRVYAVWFNMYPGDARTKWPPTLLTDARVTHYWDEGRALGTAYLANLTTMLTRRAEATMMPTADAMWDAFYVYSAEDGWRDPLPLPIAWGYPIMVTRDRLVREADTLLLK